MGYYTDFHLAWSEKNGQPVSKETDDAIQAHLLNLIENGDELGTAIEADGSFAESAKWTSCDEDMIQVSLSFPDVLFSLYGAGSSYDGHWVTYYLNGLLQSEDAEIVYPKFSKRKLRSYEPSTYLLPEV
jgi:hypothetical protein